MGLIDEITHSAPAMIGLLVVIVLVVGVTLMGWLVIRRANAEARAAAERSPQEPVELAPAPEVPIPQVPIPQVPSPQVEDRPGPLSAQPADPAAEAPVGPLAPLSARPSGDAVAVRGQQSLIEQPAPDPARLRLLGLVLGLLAEETRQGQPPQLGTAIARLGDGDQEMARARLSTLSLALMGEDQSEEDGEGQLEQFLTEVMEGDLANGLSFSSMPEFQQALNGVSPELRRKLDTIVWARDADAVHMLAREDVEALERVAVAMATALVIDTSYRRKLATEEPEGEPEPAGAQPEGEKAAVELDEASPEPEAGADATAEEVEDAAPERTLSAEDGEPEASAAAEPVVAEGDPGATADEGAPQGTGEEGEPQAAVEESEPPPADAGDGEPQAGAEQGEPQAAAEEPAPAAGAEESASERVPPEPAGPPSDEAHNGAEPRSREAASQRTPGKKKDGAG